MFNTNNLINHKEFAQVAEIKLSFSYEDKEFMVEDTVPESEYLFSFVNENNGGFERVVGMGDVKKGIIIPMSQATLKVLQEQGLFFTPEKFKTGIKISLSKEIVDHGKTLKDEAVHLANKFSFLSKTKKEKIEKVKKEVESGAIRKEEETDGSITVTLDSTFCKKVMEGGLSLAHSLTDKVVGLVSIMNSFGENDFNSFLKEADKRDKDLK